MVHPQEGRPLSNTEEHTADTRNSKDEPRMAKITQMKFPNKQICDDRQHIRGCPVSALEVCKEGQGSFLEWQRPWLW